MIGSSDFLYDPKKRSPMDWDHQNGEATQWVHWRFWPPVLSIGLAISHSNIDGHRFWNGKVRHPFGRWTLIKIGKISIEIFEKYPLASDAPLEIWKISEMTYDFIFQHSFETVPVDRKTCIEKERPNSSIPPNPNPHHNSWVIMVFAFDHESGILGVPISEIHKYCIGFIVLHSSVW